MPFEWIVQSDVGRRDFLNLLGDIHQQFYETCELGDDRYWGRFRRDLTLTRILKYYDETEDGSRGPWTGFVAIRDGYQCFATPDPSRAKCTLGNESWYIELICAVSGGGRGPKLMAEVMEAGEDSNIRYLTLSALPRVMMWYHRLGFKFTLDTSCTEDQRLSDLADDLRRVRRNSKGDDFFDSSEMADFLRLAVASGLGMKRNRGETCDDDVSCAEDGIYMVMCLPEKTMQVPAQAVSMDWSGGVPPSELATPHNTDTSATFSSSNSWKFGSPAQSPTPWTFGAPPNQAQFFIPQSSAIPQSESQIPKKYLPKKYR